MTPAAGQRSFHIHESQHFDFRAEVFNVLNHANTGIPGITLYTANTPPVEAGYTRGSFLNYAASASGGRTLRFFFKHEF